ncbi:putative arabinose 5-phosphate isomerase [Podospora australis]|uniref:Arabinose 5-phosphate isomerase n=1 Tax=Podospora australis TaxID=1536484 RepID=A0AAN7AJ96_9PEZI|nr:putative arabinose 5-phosphate isomerase [Podospora australis]
MVEQRQQRPVHNSEVYLLRQMPPTFSTIPPLSPPSPITPAEDDFCDGVPIEALSLSQPAIEVCDKKLAIEERLSNAVHVLSTETTALQNLTTLYSTDRLAREGFSRAVEAITRHHNHNHNHERNTRGKYHGGGGKIVVIGVGKSGHIAKKLVATFNSLAIQAVFLHPTEALHGDLGQIGPNDTFLLITFSGKTPELITLLPHLDRSLPLILLTSHTRPETCELIRHRPDTILLPAPIHEPETKSFGVSAPTTSTTVALTVGDALAIVASQELHPSVASVFAKNHPGGAIGAALRKSPSSSAGEKPSLVRDLPAAVKPSAIPSLVAESNPYPNPSGADVLRAGYASPSGWVRLSFPSSDHAPSAPVISPRRIRRLDSADLSKPIGDLPWLVTSPRDFVRMAADSTVEKAAEWVRGMRAAMGPGDKSYEDDAIVALMDRGECVGLIEIGALLGQA